MQIVQSNLGSGGRLGNCLFGIAAVIGQANKFNATPVIPEWNYSKYFKNKLPEGSISPTHHYQEPTFHYTPIDLSQAEQFFYRGDAVYDLRGYFQSVKYWEGHGNKIKEIFEPTAELSAYCSARLAGYNGVCAIHVRRGDYVNNPFYAHLGLDYYSKAIKYILDNTGTKKFIVCTDDLNSVFDEFCISGNIDSEGLTIEFRNGHSDIKDLFFMSRCDHNIIANSSFSWWGAYLNRNPNKVVVAPEKWFGEAAGLDTKDLYMPEWVRL